MTFQMLSCSGQLVVRSHRPPRPSAALRQFLVARLVPMTLVATALGCSGRPAPIRPVAIDADDASRAALELYDKNRDGVLADDELRAVPAIARYKSLYDGDGDGSVSAAEIAARLSLWSGQGVGFRQLYALVTLDGRPLGGAHVEFVPEPYLGEEVKPASGETGADGLASIAVKREDMPPQIAKLPISGLTGGSFKVKITHPLRRIPPQYNEATTLGEEVAFDTVRERAVFQLQSRPIPTK